MPPIGNAAAQRALQNIVSRPSTPELNARVLKVAERLADFESGPVTGAESADTLIRAAINPLREFVEPEIWQKLRDTRIDVVNQPICNAQADHETKTA